MTRARATIALSLAAICASPAGCRRRAATPLAPASQPTGSADAAPAAPVKIIYPTAPGSFVALVKKVAPSVVQLRTDVAVRGGPADWFTAAAIHPAATTDTAWLAKLQQSLGSGVIVDRAGHVLTNDHLIAGKRRIWARLQGGEELEAKVVGRDKRTDLALLKLGAKPARVVPARLGNAHQLRVGEWLLAVADPFGFGPTATVGVVHARYRSDLSLPSHGAWTFIQTDLRTHPGNSGGPVFNMLGELVGIATAVKEETQGIGFVVPIDVARQIMPMLKKRGRVVRGWVGIRVGPVPRALGERVGLGQRGALVNEVLPRGPADRAGLRRGDVIITFAGASVRGASKLPALAAHAVNRTVKVEVWRDGERHTFAVKIEAMPE